MSLTKSLRLGLFITLTAAFCARAQSSAGLLAHYPFNGNAVDATGNGHDGVVVGATLTTNRFGQPNSAYAFNGATSLIVVTNSADLQPFGDYSVSVWVDTPFFTNTFEVFFSKHFDDANSTGWTMAIIAPELGGGLPFQFGGAPLFDIYSPQADMPTNAWFHGVFTYERSSGTCKMYINGALVDTRVRAYNNAADSDPFVIGALPTWKFTSTGYLYYFAGILDDIRIYNRVLSASDVQDLYVEVPAPVLTLGKAVRLDFSTLIAGRNYQLQVSPDLVNWSNQGAPFAATNTTATQYVDVGDWNASFWRLQIAPAF